jgi:hypothetical protein
MSLQLSRRDSVWAPFHGLPLALSEAGLIPRHGCWVAACIKASMIVGPGILLRHLPAMRPTIERATGLAAKTPRLIAHAEHCRDRSISHPLRPSSAIAGL